MRMFFISSRLCMFLSLLWSYSDIQNFYWHWGDVSVELFALFSSQKAFALECAATKVIWKGFEPLTHSLEGCCSIQLSYQTLLLFVARSYC